jgi:hypothetical protein
MALKYSSENILPPEEHSKLSNTKMYLTNYKHHKL